MVTLSLKKAKEFSLVRNPIFYTELFSQSVVMFGHGFRYKLRGPAQAVDVSAVSSHQPKEYSKMSSKNLRQTNAYPRQLEFCTRILSIHPFHVPGSGFLNVNDPYHQIDKFDYVDASPVEEAVDAVNGCPPYAMAPPLPPRTGASPTGNRGPIITSGDERIRVGIINNFHTISANHARAPPA